MKNGRKLEIYEKTTNENNLKKSVQWKDCEETRLLFKKSNLRHFE